MSNEESLLATISAWPWYVSLLALILGVVLVLVVLFVFLRVSMGLWGRYRKQREVRSLHQDLMIWTRLSALVRGGKDAEQAKSELSVRLQLINRCFADGLKHVRQHRHLGKQQPWILLVGEPQAGKTLLIQNSALDWRYMRSTDTISGQNTSSELPLQIIVGPEAVLLEVKGKIFFDAWAEGSGAEFAHVIKLLRNNHRGRSLPLHGVMLCIPADALLADQAEISQRKAALIADELLRITEQLKMYLPVTVMITKLDEVLGFREYAATMGEKMSSQALGFSLNAHEPYSVARVHQFFTQTCQRLQEGALELMLSPEVLALNTQGRSRLDKTALIYLFAQNFAKLEEQLALYLNTLFASDGTSKNHYVMLKGVYFSSAQDQGICFNAAFASYSHKSIDDALYFDASVNVRHSADAAAAAASAAAAVDTASAEFAAAATPTAPAALAAPRPNPYFIKDALLRCFVPQVVASAHYNRVGRYYRQIPWMLGAGVCTALSLVAIYGAMWQAPRLSRALQDDVLYYQSLAQLLEQKEIDHAVLFGLNSHSLPQTYFEHTMPDLSSWTRLNFFAQAQLRLQMNENLPWQFYPWSYIFFKGTNTALPQRYFIYNQVQTLMAYLPLVHTIELYLNRHDNEPFSLEKRNALFALLEIASFHELNEEAINNQAYNASIMASFLDYLYPQLGANLKRELSYFLPEYDYHAHATNDTIVLNVFYQQQCERSVADFIEQWQQLRNYPESQYQQLKQQIQCFADLEQSRQELLALSAEQQQLQTVPDLVSFNGKVRALRQQLLSSYEQIQDLLPQLVHRAQQQQQQAVAVKAAVSAAAPAASAVTAVTTPAPEEQQADHSNSAALVMAVEKQLQQAYEQQQTQLQQDFTQLQPLSAALQQSRLAHSAHSSMIEAAAVLDSQTQTISPHDHALSADLPYAAQNQADNAADLQNLQKEISSELEHDYLQANAMLHQVLTGPLLSSVETNTSSAVPAHSSLKVGSANKAASAVKSVTALALMSSMATGQESADRGWLFEYEVLAQLSESLVLPEITGDFPDVDSAVQAVLALDQVYAQQLQDLQGMLDQYAETQIVQNTKDLWPQLLALQQQEAQIALYQEILAFYPYSTKAQTQLADLSLAIGRFPLQNVMSEHQLDSDYLNLLGHVSLRAEFNPQGFAALVEPVLFLQQKAQLDTLDHGHSQDQGQQGALSPQQGQSALAGTQTSTDSANSAQTGNRPFNFSQNFLQQNQQLQSLWQALQLYAKSYLNYWAHLADSVEFSAQSYYEFHLASQQFKAYELNAQLQKLYELSAQSLAQLPAELLSTKEAQQRNQAQALLEQRLQCFSLDFNEKCASTINAWSMLPYSALQATKQVNALLAAGQGERLFAVSDPKSESYLPWWDRFTRLGRSLLQHNVHEESDLTINALLTKLNAFPLAGDGEPETALSRSELKSLYQQFKLLGLEQVVQSSDQASALAQAESAASTAAKQALAALGGIGTEDEAKSAEILQRIEPMALNSQKLKALGQIGSLLHTLVAEPQPKMQLLLLGRAEQQELKQRLGLQLPLALLRYRYVSLEQQQSLSTSERVSSAQGNGVASQFGGNSGDGNDRAQILWMTGLDSSDFALHFYRYSNQEQPTITLSFSETYPLLGLYTRGDGFFDESKGSYYVPLYVQDPQLGTSIYFIGLKSVKASGSKAGEQGTPALPPPEQWPQHITFDMFL